MLRFDRILLTYVSNAKNDSNLKEKVKSENEIKVEEKNNNGVKGKQYKNSISSLEEMTIKLLN